jgi:hypothetical protein
MNNQAIVTREGICDQAEAERARERPPPPTCTATAVAGCALVGENANESESEPASRVDDVCRVERFVGDEVLVGDRSGGGNARG